MRCLEIEGRNDGTGRFQVDRAEEHSSVGVKEGATATFSPQAASPLKKIRQAWVLALQVIVFSRQMPLSEIRETA